MGQDPDTSAGEALHEGIQTPKRESGRGRGHILGCHIGVEDVESSGKLDDVAEDVVQTLGRGPLEAVLRDSITDVLDGVVGNLEFIAVRIDQFTVGSMVRFNRGHGGERGGRRRMSRGVDWGANGSRRGRDVGVCGGGSHGSAEGRILARDAGSRCGSHCERNSISSRPSLYCGR